MIIHLLLHVLVFACNVFPAVTGGLFRVSAGLKPTIGGMVLGTLIRYAFVH